MFIRMELNVWPHGNISRGFDIPKGKEDRIAVALKRLARAEYVDLLEKAGGIDFLDYHIDCFVHHLARRDRDHRYAWDDQKVRVIITNTSPETTKRQSEFISELLKGNDE